MTPEYNSIKESVLKKLETHLPEIADKFGIASIGLFGSVARGEDTPESDIDILYVFKPGFDSYDAYYDLSEYLEELFERSVDLVSPDYLKPRIKQNILREAMFLKTDGALA